MVSCRARVQLIGGVFERIIAFTVNGNANERNKYTQQILISRLCDQENGQLTPTLRCVGTRWNFHGQSILEIILFSLIPMSVNLINDKHKIPDFRNL